MNVCFNLPLNGDYARKLLVGVMSAAGKFPELSVWMPFSNVHGETPSTVDGVIGARHARGLSGIGPGTPVINVNSEPHEGTWQVCTDNDEIGRMAFEHFRANHVRDFAVVRVPSYPPALPRLDAFSMYVTQAGFYVRTIEIDEKMQSLDALANLPRQTGILMPSDRYAARLIRAARKVGIRIPDDIAVVSVNNNSQVCKRVKPQMTSIDISPIDIGYEALRLLVHIMKGKDVPKTPVLVRSQELIVRKSSVRTSITDENLEKALSYMTDHIGEPLVFDDVLGQQGLGARSLEMRFRDRFGVPPMRHLRNLRLERVMHLLETTELSVVEIGRRCGIPNANHLCALFKKINGITPLQYRTASRG